MKYHILVAFLLTSYSHFTITSIGCLAKSLDLKEPFDTKTYHLVACTCDCAYHMAKGKYSPARNQCLECYHSHDPQPLFFAKKITYTALKNRPDTYQDASSILQQLINRYRRQNVAIFDK